MTPRYGLAVSAGVTLGQAVGAGALAVLIVLDGTWFEIALLVLDIVLMVFGLLVSRRWLALLIAFDVAAEQAAESAWSREFVRADLDALAVRHGVDIPRTPDGGIDVRKWSGLV